MVVVAPGAVGVRVVVTVVVVVTLEHSSEAGVEDVLAAKYEV